MVFFYGAIYESLLHAISKFQDHDENARLKFPPSGESENTKLVGKSGVEEAEKQEKRGIHVKGVCLRVVSNSTFETWSQLYQSSEIYQKKTEPQKSDFEENSEKKQLVERVSEDGVQPTKCRNDLESENNQCDYYNFQIISQV